MRLLLDTCTFLWVIAEPRSLSPKARAAIIDPSNETLVSTVSFWEIAVKHRLGKLTLHQAPEVLIPQACRQHRLTILSLGDRAALHVGCLPDLHRDPFDRMLICQALTDSLVLCSPDPQIHRYPVPVLW